jgi:uncharacterized protein (TIGR03790 family)
MLLPLIPRGLILFLLLCSPVFSQTAENVLLVLNESSPASMDIGAYYAQKRAIQKSNILRIRTTTEDEISRGDYEQQIAAPIASWLTRNFAQDRILYFVLTKGCPLRIAGTAGQNGTIAGVDSELTLLYREMLGQTVPIAGQIQNPYFQADLPPAMFKKFSHELQDIYLVSRLDGYNTEDVKGLIDRGSIPSRDGKIILDIKDSLTGKGDSWLRDAAERLDKMGLTSRVILETTSKVITGEKKVLGYYSWGSNDPAIRVRHFGFEFVPGALAGMFVSSDGRTFREPPADWTVGPWDGKSASFAGSPQSLSGDLIREGVSGIAGHVAEPFLEATIRPNILFPAYLSGYNLIESYYMAMPYLSWQTIVVGDPLCAPYRTNTLDPREIDKGLDPGTELPAYFGTRRLRTLSVTAYNSSGVHPDTVRCILRAEARLARQDRAGAAKALEEAVARDDRLTTPQIMLASIYELEEEYDKAIERYRRLIELAPGNPVFLNNLAYALAVRKNSIPEGLILAEKAYGISPRDPNIADTLGWIYHLSGKNEKAAGLLEEAVQAGSQNAELHLHYAIVSNEMGNFSKARSALLRSLEIDPNLNQNEAVKSLLVKLRTP